MAEKQNFMTREGYEALQAELDHLKGVGRKEVAEKIKVARSFGDLSENSEYDEAKNDQAIMEARIADLELTLKNAVVIDESTLSKEHVHVGSSLKVTVKNPNGQVTERELKIVGSNEANPREGKISDESPVGSALIGAQIGETVKVNIPAGEAEYTIKEIL